MAIRQDITAEHNWFTAENRTLTFTIFEETEQDTEDIDGWEFRWVLAPTRHAEVATIIKESPSNGVAIVDHDLGTVSVTIESADTADLEAGTFWHTLARVDTDEETILSYGTAVLLSSPIEAEPGPTGPAWTYSGDPAASDRDAVRFYLGDTDEADAQLSNAEVDYLLIISGTVLGAAATGAKALSGKYARLVDKAVGDLKISYSQRKLAYDALYSDLSAQAGTDVLLVSLRVGGQSVAQADQDAEDTDLLRGADFAIGRDDWAPTDYGSRQ